MARSARRLRGFTLIELMVVVTMLAIVSSIAAPGMRSFIQSQRVKSTTMELVSDLLLARSEALKRGRAATLAPNEGGWQMGWRVSVDGTELLRRDEPSTTLLFDDAPASIVFNNFGRVQEPVARVAMTIQALDAPAEARRCIELDLSGRASALLGACP